MDAGIGSWRVTGILTVTTGDYPRFNNINSGASPIDSIVNINGNPWVKNQTPQNRFNASVVPLASNPAEVVPFNVQFGCLTGPMFVNLNARLLKNFSITERVKSQLKISAYSATNRLNRGDPNMNPESH